MPGKVKVKIVAGRNLPVMDRSSDTTDAYVEIKLGSVTHKTDVYRKSLDPQWNSEWFIFEVDDADLQDEPLQIRLMDHDTYSANDAIGKVYLDLNPLLVPHTAAAQGLGACTTVPPAGGAVLSGWLPVFDTMHGMRGEVSVIVKVVLFSDVNKFRQSSCGVQFFSTPATPCGFKIQAIHGFVKELVVNDDPEYQWIDKIRTPRASNEVRQTLFSQLSGEVRRKTGLKVLELGGNAVIGYRQMFDLEGETGLVVRGIGTAVTLVRSHGGGQEMDNGVAAFAVGVDRREHHAGRDSLRLHRSEPSLLLAPHASSRFSRLHSTDPFGFFHPHLTPPPSPPPPPPPPPPPLPQAAPPKRKISLGNLLAKPLMLRAKRSLSREIPEECAVPADPIGSAAPAAATAAGPAVVGRVRSRSAPFSTFVSPSITLTDFGSGQSACIFSVGSSEDSSEDSESPAPRLRRPFVPPPSLVDCTATNAELSNAPPAPALDAPVVVVVSRLSPSPVRSPRCLVASCQQPQPHHEAPADVSWTESSLAEDTAAPDSSSSTCVAASGAAAPTEALATSPRPSALGQSEGGDTPKGTSLTDNGGPLSGTTGGVVNGLAGAVTLSTSRLPLRQNSAPVPTASGAGGGYAAVAPPEAANLEVLEYPFLTMTSYPPGFIVHLGGTVSARSVKILLDRINNAEEPETRDNWWTEIRMEVRSHARALGCNAILGYEEHTSICEEVCVLSAAGTAAIVNLQPCDADVSGAGLAPTKEAEHKRDAVKLDTQHSKVIPAGGDESKASQPCRVCHIPYTKASIPFPIKLSRCYVCRKGYVPDVLMATIEPPARLPITGRGCLIQARLCRPKRDDSRGDHQAKEVSDGLPFLEYELHRQLINKLHVKGMNAIFGLRVQVTIGESHMVGVATGTAVFLSGLPPPTIPTVVSAHPATRESKLLQFQKVLAEAHATNRDHFGLAQASRDAFSEWTDSEDSDDDATDLDLSTGNKDACVLEIDDAEDVDVIELLIDPQPVDGFDVVTTETVPGTADSTKPGHVQAFTRVWKGKIPVSQAARQFNRCFEMILRSIYFKLRKMRPCRICKLQFNIDLPEEDEIQITVLGTAMTAPASRRAASEAVVRPLPAAGSDAEMIFHLEEDAGQAMAGRERAVWRPSRLRWVDITSLMRLPGSRVERYLGHLNFFFIRESTSIREEGGLSGFMQSFVTEVLAIVRAHVSALGGNAMVSYFMTECVLLHNPHKNQGQCLINVGGDVVQAVRYADKDQQ